jgi:hypothetical protein
VEGIFDIRVDLKVCEPGLESWLVESDHVPSSVLWLWSYFFDLAREFTAKERLGNSKASNRVPNPLNSANIMSAIATVCRTSKETDQLL